MNTVKSTTITLHIEGMSCASCVGRVERALKKVAGVQEANVNLATQQAVIYADASVSTAEMIDAVKQAGYNVTQPAPIILKIQGMSCASCVGRVERALKKIPEVSVATVNLATEQAHITLISSVTPNVLIDAVKQAGYVAELLHSASDEESIATSSQQQEMRAISRVLKIASVFTFPVFLLAMGEHISVDMHAWIEHDLGMQTSWLIQFVLTSIVLFGAGWRFYSKGIPALLRAAPDMNSLVVVGTTAAYAFSVVATFFPEWLPHATVAVYYEAAAVIVTLVLLGRYLEARAKGKTSQAITRLLGLQEKVARVRRGTQVVEVPIAEVGLHDLIEVLPGQRIAVDGVVVEGSSFVDESMISGEPIPVSKHKDVAVIGGTVNQNGMLVVEATAVGHDTVLSQIIHMVEQAQGSKLPIQALVDRVTMWFVPAVMGVALLTFVVWLIFLPAPALSFALVNAVAVLIIACPCAMGLATPTSIMVGTGRGAELGILFRQGAALQSLQEVHLVAFDKTGTLTQGKPVLTDLLVAKGFDENYVLATIAAVEAKSEHPIAQAIVAAAKDKALTLPNISDFEVLPGHGLSAVVEQARVQVGNARYMQQLGHDITVFAQQENGLASAAKSPFYAVINGYLAAMLAVADPIKDSSQQAIADLHQLGLKVVMITGDKHETAQAIAKTLGVDEVVAEVLPAGKVEAIQRLQQREGQLAFVGDGINDAPALAQADVGIALGTGTDIAIESAQVVLMSGNVQGVVAAIALSKATIRNIHQNLFWAFAYNVVLIPVAAGILYPINGMLLSPMFSAFAMSMSSIFVLSNALRLRRFKSMNGANS